MHAGIVLSAVSVIKDPKLGSMKFGFFFCCTMQFPNSQHANSTLDLATYSL